MEARYDYAGPFKTAERANEVLQQMFACDEVCEGERPEIERRTHKTASWSPQRTRYYITLPLN